ncbi:branched-chain amino acid ABC transporter permease [Bradyrhizobium sp. CCGUVB1N3]|uniref:branched-chain amino acid ABC transporter permease n=1 Tax=Bradyrhizobium sp. CCGUVB1N3 TaxID=2949629 RepID=UPI0020B2D2E9|nr:branched-chain amino acid ABC transporter permease [Bradyrhizobium sp. CCGUVB1N3]MCP3476039.1 branched-chain amino acid ABC transporter permease [Bradyrhizobium sp. CCGUVB1N3]
MDQFVILCFAVVNSIALLALISLGLAIIFGMMRVINFAHGEFIMLGGYATVIANHAGVNLWLSMLVVAPMVVGMIGAVVELLIIRRLYGHLVTTMLATWGLSLFLIGAVTAVFGNTTMGVSAPLGNIPVGAYSIGAYQLLLIAITALLVVCSLLVLHWTKYGLIARAAMQNSEMATTLGIDCDRVYATTFIIGAAISGLSGALLAPISGVLPHMGAAYVARAFVTVISGGGALITGFLSAATILGPVEALLSYFATPVVGQASLLLLAVIILRLFPTGVSSSWTRGR